MPLKRINDETQSSGTVSADGAEDAIDMNKCASISVQSVITDNSSSGGEIVFQKSNITVDGAASTTDADWTDIDTATAISGNATVWYEKIGPPWRWFRVKYNITSGDFSVENYIVTRGYVN